MRVITDRDTNEVTYVDCVEQLAPKDVPASLPRIYLATLWRPDGGEDAPRFRIVIRGPDGRSVTENEFPPVAIKPEHSSHRINIDLQGAPVKQYGEHHIRIEVRGAEGKRWTKLAEIPLDIVQPRGED